MSFPSFALSPYVFICLLQIKQTSSQPVQMFVARVESQLEGADDLNIREVINADYERMISTIFESLQQMAKMDGEGHGVAAEDKDQLNYHVIIIGLSFFRVDFRAGLVKLISTLIQRTCITLSRCFLSRRWLLCLLSSRKLGRSTPRILICTSS